MYIQNFERLCEENDNFRKVIYTGINSQMVAMTLKENEDIGEEVHDTIDQILFIIEGKGIAVIDGVESSIEEDMVVFVRQGTRHNIKNEGEKPMKLLTVYSPPAHPDGTVHSTKEEALKHE